MVLQSQMKEKISKTFLLMHKTLMSVCGVISVIMKISWFFLQLRFILGFRSLCRSIYQIKSLLFSYEVASTFKALASTFKALAPTFKALASTFKALAGNFVSCEICSKLTIKTPERRLASFWCLYC